MREDNVLICRVDPRMREIGAMNRGNIQRLLSTLALYPLTQRLHMTREHFEVLVARARREADDHALKAYFPLCVPHIQKRLYSSSDNSGTSVSVESPENACRAIFDLASFSRTDLWNDKASVWQCRLWCRTKRVGVAFGLDILELAKDG